MLRDAVRTLQYRAAIFKHARDKVVIDLGCGSGVLAIFAAQAGAKKVYAIERSKVAGLARLMFKANDVEDRIELVREDSRRVTLPERADLIVHEILGADPLNEGIVPIIDDARTRLLAPGGRLLPGRVEVCCIGLEAGRLPLAAERATREAAQLTGLYGVDFSPLEVALQSHESILMSPEHDDWALRHLLTEEAVLYDLDLSRPLADQVAPPVTVKLRAHDTGRVGGIILYFRAHLDATFALTTSPYSPRTHWDWTVYDLQRSVPVRPGDDVGLEARVEAIEDEQRIVVELT
jgi:protein arginine N-methyltransferase 1